MSARDELNRFRNLTFEDFSKMAGDQSLKPFEKIGFPAAFREGYDQLIFSDIVAKTQWPTARRIVDLGCGCGELTSLVVRSASNFDQQIVLVDSAEVLAQIPDDRNVVKVPGRFPANQLAVASNGLADIVIVYSVFHYVYEATNPFGFLDQAMKLLAPGGRLLLGDVPNVSKRNRFLATEAGVTFHQKLMNDSSKPVLNIEADSGRIDDGLIMAMLTRYRSMGYESYLLPQPEQLPLSNSREDLLFTRYL